MLFLLSARVKKVGEKCTGKKKRFYTQCILSISSSCGIVLIQTKGPWELGNAFLSMAVGWSGELC